MSQLSNRLDDLFLTTNQDYGSFYSGRLQSSRQINPQMIANELSINDQIRHERRHLPAIAYDILFDKHQSLKITTSNKKNVKPMIARRHLKYIKSNDETNEKRQIIIKNAREYYMSVVQCIYGNKNDKNSQLSTTVSDAVANELLLLNPNLSAEELAENMIAITVPLQYLGMPTINPNKPYPGTQTDCAQTPRLRYLLDHIQSVKEAVAEAKQPFDAQSIHCQPMQGTRYIYNPLTNIPPNSRI